MYGSANPTPLTATISGFVLGQTLATSGVTGTADVTTLADVNSPVNSYTLTAALGSLASANYSFSFVNGSLAVTKAPLVVTADAQTKVYGSANPTPLTATISGFVLGQTLATSGVTGTADVTTLADVNSPVNSYTLTAALGSLASANYSFSFVNGSLAVTKRPITITANAGQFKYCGQDDPVFSYTASEDLILGNLFSGALERSQGNDVGTSYTYSLGTLGAGSNYTLTLIGSNTFEIKGVSIDASASSVAIQIDTPTVTLKAVVTNIIGVAQNGVSVQFTVTNGTGTILATKSVITGNSAILGLATSDLDISNYPIGLYKIDAIAGSGCATTVAYMTIYDPNGSFITGGGWIMSPEGALTIRDGSELLKGKANFGFNAKYKKGKTTTAEVEGNTEFQFQTGNFNFKSNILTTGTLVISGAKATFRGEGTVNSSGNYGFMVAAIDGDISGGGGVDKFRIKIWDKSNGNKTVYDNQMNAAENIDATTGLGGGSIVIHEVKTKAAFIEPEVVAVEPTLESFPNPFNDRLNIEFSSVNDTQAILEIYSITGAKLETLFNGPVEGGVLYKVEYVPNLVSSQMVLYKLTMDGKTQVGKMMYNERR